MPSPYEAGEGLNNSQVTGSSTIMLPRVTSGVTAHQLLERGSARKAARAAPCAPSNRRRIRPGIRLEWASTEITDERLGRRRPSNWTGDVNEYACSRVSFDL